MENKKNRPVLLLVIVGVILLATAAGIWISGIWEYKQVQDLMESLQNTVAVEPSAEELETKEPQRAEEEEVQEDTEEVPQVEEPAPPSVEHPYKEAFLENPDMAAWIVVPDTPIDYPVMWTPEDEEYYLNRGFDKKNNKNGCLILDTESCTVPITTNLIIHGHNMKSGAMFGTLQKYKEKSYYEDHKSMTLYTADTERHYEVIAVFYSQVFRKSDQVFKYYKFFDAKSEEEFLDFYENIKKMSLYDTGVTAEFGDRFLTLSTCSYQVENGRFVVVAKETDQGDTYLPIQ